MGNDPPAFQFYGRDFDGATSTWSLEEVGAYVRLLIAQWELGGRGLPDDLERLDRTVRANASERFQEAWDELLEEKFPLCADGRRRNPRLAEQWEELAELRRVRSEAGKAGAAARYGNRTSNRSDGRSSKGDSNRIALQSPVSSLPSPDSCLQSPESTSETTKEYKWGNFEESETQDRASVTIVLWRFPTRSTARQKATSWELRSEKVEEWIETFPGLDVGVELGSAYQWILDNPEKRKTASGMTSYLGGWLRRADKQRRKDLEERIHPGGLPQPTYYEVDKEANDKAAKAKSAEHPQGCDCPLCRYVLTLKKEGG